MELQIFNDNRLGSIRAMVIDKEPYFVGKDVTEALGYSNPRDALARHVDPEDRNTVVFHDGTSGNPNMTIINESGLYSLILSSKLTTAKEFKRWVTKEVIPTIRKTGGYVDNDDLFLNTYLPNADEPTRMMFATTLATIRDLNKRIEENKPKVLFADAVSTSKSSILVRELAKLLRQNGVDMGEKRLYKWLRENGYIVKGSTEPTQRAMEMGLFERLVRTIERGDDKPITTTTTKVTGKGQCYFVNKFLGM